MTYKEEDNADTQKKNLIQHDSQQSFIVVHIKRSTERIRPFVLVAAMLLVLSAHFPILAQDGRSTSEVDGMRLVPIHDGPGSTLLSWNGTTPESPNGKRIAYFRMPDVEKNVVHDYIGEQWICDIDMTNHRKVFEMDMRTRGFEHNGSMASWIDDEHLAFRSTGGEIGASFSDGRRGTIYVVNVDTGELLLEVAAAPGSIAHKPAEGKLPFGVSRVENVKLNQKRYPQIDEPALYVFDINTQKISKIVSLEQINSFFREQGYTPQENANFIHLEPNSDASRIMSRWVPEDAGRGVLLSFDMDGGNMVIFPERPLHQIWFDNNTYIAVDQRGEQTEPIEIVQFEQDGTLIDILAGVGNHIDISPDREWIVTDNYYGTPVFISLYRRGELEPTAEFARHSYGQAIWGKGAHANPVFSRDGTSVYFTHAVSNSSVQAVRVHIESILEKHETRHDIPSYDLNTAEQPIYIDDFSEQASMKNWVSELQASGDSHVSLQDGSLEINTSAGATVWFRQALEGPLVIRYEVTVVDEGGPNDRVSDLNSFWMARDPRVEGGDHFSVNRGGTFNHYHTLRTYYVGQGGHDNTRTRFRRYDGEGNRPLKDEHDLTDEKYLLEANKRYTIELVANGGRIEYRRDGSVIYEIEDNHPYTDGYFAFRTTRNRIRIHNFSVWSLE